MSEGTTGQDQGGAGYSAEQMATIRSDLDALVERGGMTREAADAELARINGAAPQREASQQPASGDPAAPGEVVRGGLSSRDAERAREDISHSLAQGQITPEQATQYLAELDGAQTRDGQEPAELSPEAEAVQAAQAHEFQFPQYDQGDIDKPETQAFDRQARTWLQAGGFDKAMGGHMAETVNNLAAEVKQMGEAEREAWGAAQRAQFVAQWGEDAVAEVTAFVQEWSKQPGCENLISYLEATGAAGSAYVAGRLLQHARRQAALKK